jgi:hypothetical protein
MILGDKLLISKVVLSHRQSDETDWLNSFSAKVMEELCWLFQLLSVIAHFLEG